MDEQMIEFIRDVYHYSLILDVTYIDYLVVIFISYLFISVR